MPDKLKMQLQFFAADPNQQNTAKSANLEAKTIDFLYRFQEDLRDFINVLGLFNQREVTEGYTIKTKVADDTVTLQDGRVPEGEIIPLSYVEFGEGSQVEMESLKWRKQVTYENIQKYGFDEAVDRTDREVIKEIQKNIREDIFSFVDEKAVATESIKADSLQAAVATAWGTLEALFEGSNSTIAFANPMDIATYIANAEVSTQTAFGISYLQAFSNTTILSSNRVKRGEILATVPDNLNLYYIPAHSEGGQAFNLRTDDSGYIGVGRQLIYQNASIDTLFVSGIRILPEFENGIVKVPLKAAPASSTK